VTTGGEGILFLSPTALGIGISAAVFLMARGAGRRSEISQG
jgi:hypothetical protein